ncbi:ArfGAP with coiled-coil, ankyrin repeat and PH domains 3, partial [Coemansia sp. RSA 2618]
RQPFQTRKYAAREFVRAFEGAPDALAAKLVCAAGAADLPAALEALAQGAPPSAFDPAAGRTALMAAVSMADFGMLELLLLWGADVNQRVPVSETTLPHGTGLPHDACGGAALHLAARLGNVRVVWYLVRKGAHWDTPDAYGLLPLDIALEASNVPVVMALRYAAFQKASGLPPGSLRPRRPNASPAEPVDMLDMDDSFIRDWAIPPYSPLSGDDDDAEADDDDKDSDDAEFGELQAASPPT